MQILNRSNFRRLLFSLAIFGLVGCDDFSYLGREDAAVVVKAAEGTDPELTRKILVRRLADYRPSIFSTVEGMIEDEGRVRIVFHRGTPDPKYFPTLIFQRGVLTATLETGELVYTNEDIVSAEAASENGKVYLKLVVTDEAARRVEEITSRNIGKVIQVVLDGFNIFNTTITETFSREFKLSAEYPLEEVRVIEVLLQHGALPGRALIVNVEGEFGEPKAAEPAADKEPDAAAPAGTDESGAADPAAH